MTLLTVWILYAAIGVTAFSVVFIWAVRSRQFTELDRQRSMALDSEESPDAEYPKRDPSRIDRYTWLLICLLALAAIAASLIIGLRGA